MSDNMGTRERLIARIIQLAREKPDCQWLQEAVYQLTPQEQVSNTPRTGYR